MFTPRATTNVVVHILQSSSSPLSG
jgi:hypothetical protein